MQSRLEFAVGLEVGIGPVMKQTVGQRSTQALVEEHEKQRNFHALVGEAISVMSAVPFEQTVPFYFAQVLARPLAATKKVSPLTPAD
jgi:hypothetical protein